MEWIFQYFDLLLVALLLILGYGFGRYAESRHYRSILKREHEYRGLLTFSAKTPPPGLNITSTELVVGSVVVSVDYFKRFVAGLRKLIGGRLRTYETLIDRGRREALLRMKEHARELGANAIVNVKLETASISKGKRNSIGSIEVYAYGTAIKHQPIA